MLVFLLPYYYWSSCRTKDMTYSYNGSTLVEVDTPVEVAPCYTTQYCTSPAMHMLIINISRSIPIAY